MLRRDLRKLRKFVEAHTSDEWGTDAACEAMKHVQLDGISDRLGDLPGSRPLALVWIAEAEALVPWPWERGRLVYAVVDLCRGIWPARADRWWLPDGDGFRYGSVTRAALRASDDWLLRDVTPDEGMVFLSEATEAVARERMDALRIGLAADHPVMWDADQVMMGVVATVLSGQVAWWRGEFTESVQSRMLRRLYSVAMEAAYRWAERHGEPSSIMRMDDVRHWCTERKAEIEAEALRRAVTVEQMGLGL